MNDKNEVLYTDYWHDLSTENKKQILEAWAKTANRRLRRLRESGVISSGSTYAAEGYLKRINRKTFPTKAQNLTEAQINSELTELQGFLSDESTTLTGLKKIHKAASEVVADKVLKRILEKDLSDEKRNTYQNIYKKVKKDPYFGVFLHSKLYKQLKDKIDSDKIINYYSERSVLDGASFDEIIESFEEVLNNDIGYDTLLEKSKKSIPARPVKKYSMKKSFSIPKKITSIKGKSKSNRNNRSKGKRRKKRKGKK